MRIKSGYAFSLLAISCIFFFCYILLSSDSAFCENGKKDFLVSNNVRSFLKNMTSDEVKIGSYVLNIRKLEVSSGTWIVDFYVWLAWKNQDISPINFEIMNGAIDFKDEPIYDTLEVEGQKYSCVTRRIVASITNDLNFKNYPLDVQKLTIEIEDRELSVKKMKYVTDSSENNIDDFVKIQGWEIKEKQCEISKHKYKTNFGLENQSDEDLTYSRYIFSLNISRPRFSSMLKLLLPLSIILSLSFLSFALSADKISQRISLCVSTVFTAVAFHINLTSAIPQVSYLTLADRLMISSYFILFCTLISTIFLIKYIDKQQIEKAEKINKILGALVPFFGILFIIIQFII